MIRFRHWLQRAQKRALVGLRQAAAVSLTATVVLLAHVPLATAEPQARDAGGLDTILVIDNSGSMKKYDPHFLTRDFVLNFITAIPKSAAPGSRVGMVVYDRSARLVQGLQDVSDSVTKADFETSLQQIDFTGRWTNSPSAIERAIYELKSRGRADASKAIIFLTDGFVDTGDEARDRDGRKWLREELAEESRKAQIRIFGIAFTDQADFQLIQALALKTDGRYYRAYQAEDLPGIFENLFAGLQDNPASRAAAPSPLEDTSLAEMAAPKRGASAAPLIPGRRDPATVPSRRAESGGSSWLPLVAVGAGLALFAVVLIARRRWQRTRHQCDHDLEQPRDG